jgi:hypothetical protein
MKIVGLGDGDIKIKIILGLKKLGTQLPGVTRPSAPQIWREFNTFSPGSKASPGRSRWDGDLLFNPFWVAFGIAKRPFSWPLSFAGKVQSMMIPFHNNEIPHLTI